MKGEPKCLKIFEPEDIRQPQLTAMGAQQRRDYRQQGATRTRGKTQEAQTRATTRSSKKKKKRKKKKRRS